MIDTAYKGSMMNKLALIATALFFSGAAIAAERHDDKRSDFCNSVYGLAGSIMTARQHGGSMPDMMKIAIDNDSKMSEEMVKEAFSKSKYSTESIQKEVIADFSNEWYLTCIKQFDEKK